jgi:mannose-6-phosphate isomerase
MGVEHRVPPGPWPLLPNRVSRFYRGGLLLDRFRDAEEPADTNEPEDWVGSATRAWTPPGEPPTDEGLGGAEVDGARRRIIDLVAEDLEAVAGPGLAAHPGTTGVLVKLLDAAIRLPVHAHPTRAFARRHLGSAFGKAEAWIVLGTRQVEGERPPHVRLGFRRSVGRDELRAWIDDESSEALLDALHICETSAGDVWFVPAGTPHAIGAGVFILEIQEPTDFSIVAETGGFPIDRHAAHLGLGWDVTMDAIDRRAMTDRNVDDLRGAHRQVASGRGWERVALPPSEADPFFSADRVRVAGGPALPFAGDGGAFAVAVVTEGTGTAGTKGGRRLHVRRGDAFAVPAISLAALELEADEPLDVIVCRPGTTPPEPVG